MLQVLARQIMVRFSLSPVREAAYEDLRTEEQRRQAMNWRSQRRFYAQAMRVYRRLLARGVEGLEPPDINTIATLRRYLDPPLLRQYLQSLETRTAAPLVPTWDTRNLPSHERQLIRNYYRAGYCPESLKLSFVQGLYDLCIQLVGPEARSEPLRGFLSDKAFLRQAAPTSPRASLKLLMEVQRNARKIRNRPMQLPLRPQQAYFGENGR